MTEFVKVRMNDHTDVCIPLGRAMPGNTKVGDANVYTSYEPKRCDSMEQRLKKGDVLFDIGIADGWLSAMYAQWVGAENMCLFEPTWQVWPNIKAIWEANNLCEPRSAFYGFVGERTELVPPAAVENFQYKGKWPVAVYGSMIEEMCFRSLRTGRPYIPQTTIDDFVARTNIIPRGISIDVEGAEFLVLQGAKETLLNHKPLIWLSLHDINGAITYDYNSCKEEVFQYLTACGYKMTWLEDYGDSHWFCE